MTTRLLATFMLCASLFAVACGGSADPGAPASQSPAAVSEASPQPAGAGSPEAGATATNVDAGRFVFGATPGKPVIYWIHTNW